MRGQAGSRTAKVKAPTAIREFSTTAFSAQRTWFPDLEMSRISKDMDEFVFLYEYPLGADTSIPPRSLQDLLRDSKMKSLSVTGRLKLALEICKTLLTVHTAGWLQKNIRSEDILFFTDRTKSRNSCEALMCPYLTRFAFSRADSPVEISDQAFKDPLLDIYRHPQALANRPSRTLCIWITLLEWSSPRSLNGVR